MTDFTSLLAADKGEAATTIELVGKSGFEQWLTSQGETARAAIAAARFNGSEDRSVFLPGNGDWRLAVGLGDSAQGHRWTLATAAASLPEGRYRVQGPLSAAMLHGWLMAQHHFDRYKRPDDPTGPRTLLIANVALIDEALDEARAAASVRDLVDTPAEGMGPAEVEQAVRSVAAEIGGRADAVVGEALLDQGFPMVHAVGRASSRRPRIVTLEWGNPAHPLVAIVGKGITFDTGGLDLKTATGMALMKKDMGGAAHALALARLVARARLNLRLKLVIATADNAVSGNAIRPGDVIATRKGLTVEIGNTDAEGRLVLSDALTLAGEANPALVLDFATLTGAARVALGPDLPALFSNDDTLAAQLLAAAEQAEDPLWRLPLWQPYTRLFRSTIADLNNVSDSGFAGASIAALFLQRFVPEHTPWAHFDLYAWNPTARPGRPKGGAAMAIYACLAMLKQRFA